MPSPTIKVRRAVAFSLPCNNCSDECPSAPQVRATGLLQPARRLNYNVSSSIEHDRQSDGKEEEGRTQNEGHTIISLDA